MKNKKLFDKIVKECCGYYIPLELLEQGIKVDIRTVEKTNETLTAFSLICPGKDLSPTVYVEHLFKEYTDSAGFTGDEREDRENILNFLRNQVLFLYSKQKQDSESLSLNELLNPETLKERIYYQLINGPANKELLTRVPHRKSVGDLVIVYRLLVSTEMNDEGIASALINNGLAEHIDLDEEELFKMAMINTPVLFPVNLTSLYHLFDRGITDENVLDYADIICKLFQNAPFLILTNKQQLNGAGTILYENVLSRIAEAAETDLVILPSSLHEVLLTPYMGEKYIEDIKMMVSTANTEATDVDMRLSNSVFIYERKEGLRELTAGTSIV